MVEVFFAGQPLVEARMRHTLGLSYRSLGESKKAVEQLEKSYQLFLAHLGHAHPDTLLSMANLGQSYAAVDRRDEARAMFENLLPLQIANLGADDDKVHQTKTYLADAYQSLGRHADAIRLGEEVLLRDRTRNGLKHRQANDWKAVVVLSVGGPLRGLTNHEKCWQCIAPRMVSSTARR